MSIDITAAGVSMDEVAKDEDPGYRPNGEPTVRVTKNVVERDGELYMKDPSKGGSVSIEPSKEGNTGVNTGAPIPQAHGGAIHAPGNPGNKGGPGRPPSEIRLACREHGYRQIANLGKLVDKLESGDIEMSVTEQTRLSEALNKYGVGSTIAYTLDSEETLKLTIETVERLYPGVISATKVIDSVMEQLK